MSPFSPALVVLFATTAFAPAEESFQQPMHSTPDRITRIDASALCRSVLPGGIELEEPARLVLPGVTKAVRASTGERFEFRIGIYETAEAAGSALGKTMPEIPMALDRPVCDESFLSVRACHLRLGNVAVLIVADSIHSSAEWTGLGAAVEAALRQPGVAVHGAPVDAPKVFVLAAARAEGDLRVQYVVDGAGPVLRSGHASFAKELGPMTFEDVVPHSACDVEPTLRIARASGEVSELSWSQLSDHAPELPPSDPDATPWSDQEAGALAAQFEQREGQLIEQAELLEKMATRAPPILDEFFRRVLGSRRHAVIRSHALQGLARIHAGHAIDLYAALAAAEGEAELIRRDAIRLVGRYGTASHVSLLDEILSSGNPRLFPALEIAREMLASK